jgi:3-oxoadipate enol-lactonase
MPGSEQTAKLRDGTRIAYVLRGDPNAARRIALVHSLAMDHTFWDGVVEALRGSACVLTHDCRGHGASGKPAGAMTVEAHADDLSQLLDAIGWQKAIVAGASMGGCIALAFAIRHAQRVSALGLIDTTAWYGADAPKNWEQRASAALTAGLATLTDFQVTRWFSDKFRAEHPQIVKESVDIFVRNDVDAYAATCRMLGACDLRSGLASIKAPTAIVVGEEDYATPLAMAEALHKGIAGSTLQVLMGVRHLTPLERPQEIAAALGALAAHAGA